MVRIEDLTSEERRKLEIGLLYDHRRIIKSELKQIKSGKSWPGNRRDWEERLQSVNNRLRELRPKVRRP